MKRNRLATTLCATALTAAVVAPATHAQLDLLQQMGTQLLQGGASTGSASTGAGALANDDIVAGLKEALRVGTDNVVSRLGTAGGFANDPVIHIPLPESMRSMQDMLGRFGMSGMLDDLELRLNRAAEAATPRARELFVDAISKMTLEDARAIYDGPDDAATRYFERHMSPQLAAEMRPVVDQSLAEVGAIRSYDNAVSAYKSLPLVPDVKADLSQHVVEGGMAGIFHYLAQEEAKIRTNPMARSTELLKRVFGP
jgi:hypothetical protein